MNQMSREDVARDFGLIRRAMSTDRSYPPNRAVQGIGDGEDALSHRAIGCAKRIFCPWLFFFDLLAAFCRSARIIRAWNCFPQGSAPGRQLRNYRR